MQVVHIIFTCLVIKLADAIDSTVGSYFRKEKDTIPSNDHGERLGAGIRH